MATDHVVDSAQIHWRRLSRYLTNASKMSQKLDGITGKRLKSIAKQTTDFANCYNNGLGSRWLESYNKETLRQHEAIVKELWKSFKSLCDLYALRREQIEYEENKRNPPLSKPPRGFKKASQKATNFVHPTKPSTSQIPEIPTGNGDLIYEVKEEPLDLDEVKEEIKEEIKEEPLEPVEEDETYLLTRPTPRVDNVIPQTKFKPISASEKKKYEDLMMRIQAEREEKEKKPLDAPGIDLYSSAMSTSGPLDSVVAALNNARGKRPPEQGGSSLASSDKNPEFVPSNSNSSTSAYRSRCVLCNQVTANGQHTPLTRTERSIFMHSVNITNSREFAIAQRIMDGKERAFFCDTHIGSAPITTDLRRTESAAKALVIPKYVLEHNISQPPTPFYNPLAPIMANCDLCGRWTAARCDSPADPTEAEQFFRKLKNLSGPQRAKSAAFIGTGKQATVCRTHLPNQQITSQPSAAPVLPLFADQRVRGTSPKKAAKPSTCGKTSEVPAWTRPIPKLKATSTKRKSPVKERKDPNEPALKSLRSES